MHKNEMLRRGDIIHLTDEEVHYITKKRRKNKRDLIMGFNMQCGCCKKAVVFNDGEYHGDGVIYENYIQFHHVDDTREENIAIGTLQRQKIKSALIFNEAQHTVALCDECHIKVHSGEIAIPVDVTRFDIFNIGKIDYEQLKKDGFTQIEYNTKEEIVRSNCYKNYVKKPLKRQEPNYYNQFKMPDNGEPSLEILLGV